MKTLKNTILIGLIITISSCTTPVGLINAHPEFWQDKTVTVKGKVVSTMHLEDLSIFTIKESGQRISIVTQDFLPVINDNVKVKGTVENKFYYQRDTLLVIKENTQAKNSKKPNFNKAVN